MKVSAALWRVPNPDHCLKTVPDLVIVALAQPKAISSMRALH